MSDAPAAPETEDAFCSECLSLMVEDDGAGHLCPVCDVHEDCEDFPCGGYDDSTCVLNEPLGQSSQTPADAAPTAFEAGSRAGAVTPPAPALGNPDAPETDANGIVVLTEAEQTYSRVDPSRQWRRALVKTLDRAISAEAAREEAEQHIVQLTQSRDRAEAAHEAEKAAHAETERLRALWFGENSQAQADLARLRAGVEALADEYANADIIWRNVGSRLRALLAGGGER